MSDEVDDLRQLANEIERVGRASAAWSMTHKIVYNCTDQINCMASIMELRRKLATFADEHERAKVQAKP